MNRFIFRMTLATMSLVMLATGWAQAQLATALTNTGSIVTFSVTNPSTILSTNAVTGLNAGDVLVAIDYRPVDQQLIGLGYNTTAGTASVYTITSAGVATSINGNTLNVGAGLGRLMADFNPTANAVRLTSSATTSNNRRIPTGGTGALATDTDLNPANTGIRSSAYSRNNAGGGTSGATTLYLIDGTNNSLVTQGSIDFFTGNGTSPNTGTLSTIAALTGVTGSSVVGFDIFNPAGTAATSPGSAYLATGNTFFTFDLTTGAATSVGSIGTGLTISDFAVVAVPEPSTIILSTIGVAGFGMVVYRRKRSRRHQRKTA